MRKDISKVLCERQRVGSRNTSLKTALKLDPNLDYEEHDWGPTYGSSGRRRQEGRCNPVTVTMGKKRGGESKKLNENLSPLYRFLAKAEGRPWDAVYSEICKNIKPNKAVDFHVLQHVGWHVDTTEYTGYRAMFVDSNGILRSERRPPVYRRPPKPISAIHLQGNTWLKLQVHKTHAKCGCVHFKIPAQTVSKYGRWSSQKLPAVCIHNNQPVARPLWYVETYGFHQPDEIYKTYRLKHYIYPDGTVSRSGMALGLSNVTPVVHVYYRDVPEKMKEPFLISKKAANKKHLVLIKAAFVKLP